MKRFDQKVVIVTGGASGIGEATALLFGKEGAYVVVADIDTEGASRVAEAIRSKGGTAIPVTVDMGDRKQVEAMVNKAVDTYGGLHILHNNAANLQLVPGDLVLDTPDDIYEKMFSVMVLGTKRASEFAMPHMLKQGGVIVNTSSIDGQLSDGAHMAYSACKAGVDSLTRSIATAYGKQGVRCVAVAPGLILTPTAKVQVPPPVQDIYLRHHVTPRLGKPEDVASLVAYLASEEAAFLTGHTLPIDGGLSSHFAPWADLADLMS